ncbi:MAG: S8 family serine peptidase [Vicinamibacterales bacterium]
MKSVSPRRHRNSARCAALVLVTGLAIGGTATFAAAQVQWRTGVGATPKKESAADVAQLLRQSAGRPDKSHVVAHFAAALTDEQKSSLKSAGIGVLDYVGSNAYFANVSRNVSADRAAALDLLLTVEDVNPAWKLHPDLYAGIIRGWTVVDGLKDFDLPPLGETTQAALEERGLNPTLSATLMLHMDVAQDDAARIVEQMGGSVMHRFKTVNALHIWIPMARVRELASNDLVRFIEPAMPPLTTCNDDNRVRTGVNTVNASPYGLSGAGVDVLVYDGGTIASHPGLAPRIFTGDGSGVIGHATHVAGTIGGTGAGEAGNPHRGMAPNVARFLSYGVQGFGQDFFRNSTQTDTENDYLAAIAMGADVANNSVGNNIESNGYPCPFQGDYGTFNEMLDSLIRGERNGQNGVPFRTIWAAGNERQGSRCNVEPNGGAQGFYSIAPPQAGKNQICVGAINSNDDSITSFTSWGPTDDGRLKPDFCAPGCQSNGDGGVTSCAGASGYTSLCGTSMASPTTCGVAALFIEDWRTLHPGMPDPLNSTIKSIFAHTAVDLDDPGPDFKTGFGSIRAPAIIDLLRAGNYIENQVGQGQTYTFVVIVAPTDTQFKATIVWDDFRGNAAVQTQLVNDLDLVVTSPSGTRYFPWTLNPLNPDAPAVQTQEDHLNNIEQVFVQNPMPGGWTVQVRGTSVPQGPQRFSVAASPLLVNCADAGIAQLDSDSYGCEVRSAGIRLVDCGLNTSNSVIDTATVIVQSTSDPAGQLVTLTETAPESAEFIGSAPLSPTDTPGTVYFQSGDTITLVYIDADNGSGGTNVMVTDAATITCFPPVAAAASVNVVTASNSTITLGATDDGVPAPLTFTITQLPTHGRLREIGSGQIISSVPYVLPGGLNRVLYRPIGEYLGPDSLQFRASDGGAPPSGGNSNIATVSISVTPLQSELQYEFLTNDQDPGWTMQGLWAFGAPTGGGSFNHDPMSGFTGSNVIGFNLLGNYTNAIRTPLYVTSTPMDLSPYINTRLEFRRWLGIDASDLDHAAVQVSSDGSTWNDVWVHTGPAISENAWSLQSYDISAFADQRSSVRLRWVMGTTNNNVVYPGWNIDDVRVYGLVPTPVCTCDWNGMDSVNSQDFFDFLTDLFSADADYNADGTTNSQDFFDFIACFFSGC